MAAIVGNELVIAATGSSVRPRETLEDPTPDDDAWVIFTSGSTGKPKGVAVTHRSAAAFVDAESRMFLQAAPIGKRDRVMAGLSVAFDASCEEMWLAWAYGACLVPAPRSLVRSGVDVGPWLVANGITIVSTVPTLVSLWPSSSLDKVRLLIMGGEACPAELAARLQREGREVWNTYGPTEATVVACGALLDGSDPVRIGLPLDGWDLAVVDAEGNPVAEGESGELIIGGVGLARYLDPEKDAEKYAAMPGLGWERAYRSGDVVRNDPLGLVFAGRADDQIKLGGRRIELGEIDDQLLRLPGVTSAAAAVRSTKSGNRLLVGYLTIDPDDGEAPFSQTTAMELLRHRLPAPLVPRLAVVDELPTRTSGKVDRDALPWPIAKLPTGPLELIGTQAWIAEIWNDVLAADVSSPTDDFFDFGGGSLTAAQMVSRLREKYPDVAVGDVYANPTIATLAAAVEEIGGSLVKSDRRVLPIPLKTQAWPTRRADPVARARGPSVAELADARHHDRRSGDRSVLAADVPLLAVDPRHGDLPDPAGPDDPRRAVDPPRHARRHARPTSTWGQDPPSAVAGRSDPGRAGGDRAGRGAVVPVLRPRSRARRSRRASISTRCRRSPGSCTSARMPRSNPRSISAATGSTATSCTSARSGSDRAPGSARAARSHRVPKSARTPRWRPARSSSGRSPRPSSGPARQPSARRRLVARGRPSSRRRRPSGSVRTASSRS